MTSISILGLAAELLIIVAQIPQIYKSFKTKSTDDLSALTIVCVLLGLSMWLAYGLLKPDGIIVIANAASVAMFAVVLYAKIKFSR